MPYSAIIQSSENGLADLGRLHTYLVDRKNATIVSGKLSVKKE